jgi:hypothetical protein
MPGPYSRFQLQGQVLDELQDPNAVYFNTIKVREFLNKGMATWCERTRARRATTTIDVLAEQPIVSLASVTPIVLEVLRVALPSSEGADDERALCLMSLEDLEREDRDWRSRRGQPYGYTRWDQGHLALRLFPAPDTALSSHARSDGRVSFESLYGMMGDLEGVGDVDFDSLYGAMTSATLKYGGLRVDYIAGATDMGADSDTPYATSGVPPEYHEAIGAYAVARCLLMETALKQVKRAEYYMAMFEAAIQQATQQVEADFQPEKPIRRVRLAR